MGLVHRWKTLLANRVSASNSASQRAGAHAEFELLAEVARRIEGSGWRVWHGVRVPFQGRRREIDLVICSLERVYVIELKNWSGTLELHGDDVVQVRRHHAGIIHHGHLFDTMEERVEALATWHGQRGDEVPPLESLLVLYNPRLIVSPVARARYGHLMLSADTLLGMLPAPTAIARRSTWWERLFGPREAPVRAASLPKISRTMRAFHSTMDALGSWDQLEYHGGKMVVGDVLRVGPRVEALDGSHPHIGDRAKWSEVLIDAPRSWLSLFRRDLRPRVRLIGREGELVEAVAQDDATLWFHAAGQPKPEEVRIAHLRALRFGYTKKPGRTKNRR